MRFDFLKTVDDTTTDFDRAFRRCQDAERQLDAGYPNQCIDFLNQALMIVIKSVYKIEGLALPTPKKNQVVPPNAAYINRDSSFAEWLDNQEILELCHDLRKTRNMITPAHIQGSEYNASKTDAIKKEEQLERILRCICEKLPETIIRNPTDFHQPCVILLDISGSMLGVEGTPIGERPIDELCKAIRLFKEELQTQRDVNPCTEISFITFNTNVDVIQPFKNADRFNLPQLCAGGKTSMNEAIVTALEIIESQKEIYQREDVQYYRPWLYLLSDGYPTDNDKEETAKKKLRDAIEGNHLVFYPVQIGKWANKEHLMSYYPESYDKKTVIITEEGHFRELFEFFSNSIKDSLHNSGYIDLGKRKYLKGINVESF